MCLFDGSCDLRVLRGGIQIARMPAAPVDLDIIEALTSELKKVLTIMTETAGAGPVRSNIRIAVTATKRAGIGIDPRLQTETMQKANDIGMSPGFSPEVRTGHCWHQL